MSTPGPIAPLTELAKKYTHPTGPKHTEIARTGKSGLTPLSTPISPSPAEQARYEELDLYQRDRFKAFSTKDLVDIDAFARTSFEKVYYDDNPINKLFARNKWSPENDNSVPCYLLPGGLGGYWQV